MNELVNVYAKTKDGWKLLFKDISENVASDIWRECFKTGENRISIESKKDKLFFEKQAKSLHK